MPHQRRWTTVPINPVFVDFLSNAMRLSRSLYPEGSESPRYSFALTPRSEFYDRFVLTMNGERDTVKSGSPSKRYTWNGSPSYQFQVGIIRKGDSASNNIDSPNGPWAVYRFLYGQAESTAGTAFTFFVKSGTGGKRMTDDAGRDLSYQFTLDSSVPIAEFRDMLARCPSKVAQ